MTFREFVEQSLSDFEGHLRREGLEASTIEMRLRGARQFALLLLGEPHQKGEATTVEFRRIQRRVDSAGLEIRTLPARDRP
jgi:hypothetical protein